jgi:hypothetical protein
MAKDREKIACELNAAKKFIEFFNKTQVKDFVVPYNLGKDASIDALTHRESSPDEILKMQIVKSDFRAEASLGKRQIYEACRDTTEKIEQTILEPILHKSRRYSKDYKKDMVLLLDGWWTVTEDDLKYFKTHCLKSYLKLRDTGFKEIWFVSEKWDGPVYRLWPYA